MKSRLLIAFFFFLQIALLGECALAQMYHIEATIKGIKDTTAILGHYKYSGQQFIAKDTARADVNGHMVFEGNESLPGGMYLILLPDRQKLVQIVYSGQEKSFSIETDTSSIVKSMIVRGSQENLLFYDYQNKLERIVEEVEVLNMKKRLNTDQYTIASTDKEINEQQKKYIDLQKKFIAEHADTFTAKLLKVSMEPEIPTAPVLANGRKDSVWVFNYYKNHYWDNFDFSDERLLWTPFLQPKLERYVKELIVQVPDSVIKDADMLVQKATKADNKELKLHIVYYIRLVAM